MANHDEQDDDEDIVTTMKNKWDKYKTLCGMIEIFKYADDDERENIAQSFEAAEFKDQREIVVQGHIADAFYIIEEGSATVYKPPSLHEPYIPLLNLGRGDHFGAISLVFDRPSVASVKANGDLTCAKMCKSKFKATFKPVILLLQQKAFDYESFIGHLV